MPDERGPFLASSLRYMQENIRRAGPAASASYTLIGAILLLGGAWVCRRPLAGNVALVPAGRVDFWNCRGLLRAREDSVETVSMKSAIAITGACLVTWSIGAFLVVPGARVELSLGMALPLVLAVGTMALFERTFARDPQELTPLMIKAFGAKMVLVGAYVAVIVGLTSLDPIVFISSFSLYFIGLHLTEAMQLRSLFS